MKKLIFIFLVLPLGTTVSNGQSQAQPSVTVASVKKVRNVFAKNVFGEIFGKEKRGFKVKLNLHNFPEWYNSPESRAIDLDYKFKGYGLCVTFINETEIPPMIFYSIPEDNTITIYSECNRCPIPANLTADGMKIQVIEVFWRKCDKGGMTMDWKLLANE